MSTLIILTAEPENFVPTKLKEEAEKAGFETKLINPIECCVSIANDLIILCNGEKLENIDFCIPRMSEDGMDYKTSLMYVLLKSGTKILNTGESMQVASNKVTTQKLLNDVSIHTPKTALILNEEQLEHALSFIGGKDKFPVIVKTVFGTHGVGVIRVDSLPSLKSVVQQLLKTNVNFMLQEFIEHSESSRIMLLGDECVGAVIRSIPDGDFRSNAHQGAELKVFTPTEEEITLVKKCNEALGIVFGAVDYITDKDGNLIVLEVNGSPGFEAMQKVVDYNIAEKIIAYCKSLVDVIEDPNLETTEKEENTITVQVDAGVNEPAEVNEPAPEVVAPEVSNVRDEQNDIIGAITSVIIKNFNDEQPILARVDTGATHSSINGDDITIIENMVKFKFNEVTYKFPISRNSKIRTAVGPEPTLEERPVILVDVIINGNTIKNIEFNVTDRDHMKYSVLLGRSTLVAGGFLVNPADEHLGAQKVITPEEE